MSNGKSRRKGARGELAITHLIPGARHTGLAYMNKPDVVTDSAVYEVKNKAVSGGVILREIERLEKMAPEMKHYVVFKPKRGEWLICERLKQHIAELEPED